MLRQLTVHDFARQFGTAPQMLPAPCQEAIASGDFRYRELTGEERDRQVIEILQRLDSGTLSLAGQEGKARWEKGWTENLERLLAGKSDLSGLVPRYIRPGMPVRLDRQYVVPQDADFELKWYQIFRDWLFHHYLREVQTVYEFGCGSGHNVARLAGSYPGKTVWGLDWAQASVAIVEQLREAYGWDVHGRLFDFFSPSADFHLAPGSAVLTIGALEQTGTNFEPFLQYVLREAPALCVHVEPIVEWFDPTYLLDYLAIRFLQVRQYMSGLPQRLAQLQAEGHVEILHCHRAFVGSLYVEGYCQLVWRPVRR